MTELPKLMGQAVETLDIYAEAFDTPRDAQWLLMKLTEELGEMTGAWMQLHGQSRGTATAQELADEAADVLGFLLAFAAREGIDLEAAFQAKWGKYAKG
ncbi:MAG: phosphoribosyl-ATP pyrophosphohydrolase [Pseudomonadota bacterium]